MTQSNICAGYANVKICETQSKPGQKILTDDNHQYMTDTANSDENCVALLIRQICNHILFHAFVWLCNGNSEK